jgi:curved DNA-binding protein CbpA
MKVYATFKQGQQLKIKHQMSHGKPSTLEIKVEGDPRIAKHPVSTLGEALQVCASYRNLYGVAPRLRVVSEAPSHVAS